MMDTNAQMRAAKIANRVLQLVYDEPQKAYPNSIMERVTAGGQKISTVEAKNALEFLRVEGCLNALPPVKSNRGRPRLMYELTPRGLFHLNK